MNATQTVPYTLELTEAEQPVLQRLLDQAVIDLHGERRRTEAPKYHAEVVEEETLVRNLAEKVRRMRAAC